MTKFFFDQNFFQTKMFFQIIIFWTKIFFTKISVRSKKIQTKYFFFYLTNSPTPPGQKSHGHMSLGKFYLELIAKLRQSPSPSWDHPPSTIYNTNRKSIISNFMLTLATVFNFSYMIQGTWRLVGFFFFIWIVMKSRYLRWPELWFMIHSWPSGEGPHVQPLTALLRY